MQTIDLTTQLKHAKQVAILAGNSLAKNIPSYRTINFESSTDVKLQADVESENLIREYLGDNSPYPIIGEEQGGAHELLHKDEYYWVIDPLDGTYNYLRDMPFACVSIGLMKGLKPILGVIHDFNLKISYYGIASKGLYINETQVQPKWAEQTDQACLMTGFPAGRSYEAKALETFVSRVRAFKKIRMIGSAALALAYVASGRGDVYIEESIRLWDIAAGLALIEAAGGSAQINIVDTKSFKFDVCAAGKQEWLLL